jgi:geranylgeranyl pyrophosphate synthase
MELIDLYQPISEEIKTVKNMIKKELSSLYQIKPFVAPYFNGRAKYIRPFLALMAGQMLTEGKLEGPVRDKLLDFAVAIELLHTASLVHDDIMDNELLRRGQVSLNVKYGPQNAVILGDMIYTRAFRVFSRAFDPATVDSLLDIVNKMCYGQLLENKEYNPDKKAYLNFIRLKTGFLMGFSCTGIFHCCNDLNERWRVGRLYKFGIKTGVFYQMVDDFVDRDAALLLKEKDIFAKKQEALKELKDFPSSIYKSKLVDFLDFIQQLNPSPVA